MSVTTPQNATSTIYLSTQERRLISTCNRNYSHEGIYHPDRTLMEYDLLYMLQGNWEIWEDNDCYTIGANDVLLLEPGKHHYSQKKCTPEMKNLYIHFSMHKMDGLPASDALCLGKVTDCTSCHSILHLFEKIIEIYWADHTANKEFRLGAQLDLLLAELSDLHVGNTVTSDTLITEIIHRFYCAPDRFFSPEELACDYGISLRTLSSRFKKITGQSIHQYQLRLKLDMAYDVLPLNPGRGLRDIALSFGFYDEFQFSRLFKRQFGISPSERRKC